MNFENFCLLLAALALLFLFKSSGSRTNLRTKQSKNSIKCLLCGKGGFVVAALGPSGKAAKKKHGGYVCPPCRDNE